MKNIFKKNHIIITALAIMIVIAGYLSFSSKNTPQNTDSTATMTDPNAVSQSSDQDALSVVDDTTGNVTTDVNTDGTASDTTSNAASDAASDTNATTTTDTGAATTDDQTTPVDNGANTSSNDTTGDNNLASAQSVTDNGELNTEDGTPGEAVLANASIDASYFISSKLDREQVRAKNKADLMDIINSQNVSEEDKKVAIDSMIKMTENAEKESSAEMLLEAKGFDGAVVFIVNDQVNVVVNATNLTDQQLAIIEDVVKGETDITVDKIHINPVVVQD